MATQFQPEGWFFFLFHMENSLQIDKMLKMMGKNPFAQGQVY